MSVKITENQLVSWVHRLTHFVAWLSVAIFNVTLLCIVVIALYLSGTTGNDIYNSVVSLGGNLGLSTAWQALSFFGISGFALISAYAIALKKILLNLSLRYILIKQKSATLNKTPNRSIKPTAKASADFKRYTAETMTAFPFNRTTTPDHDLVRGRETYDVFSENHHTRRTSTDAIVFKAQYMELDRRLLDLFSYVAPAEGNKATYSVTLATLIRNAASLFELGSRWLYPQAFTFDSGKQKIFHYLSLEVITKASTLTLRSPVFYDTFSSLEIYQPFTNLTSWNRKSAPTSIHVPAWWTASNKLKHTNEGLKQYGTLENAIAAVGASFAFLHAVFGPGMVFGMYADGQGRIHSEVTSSVFIPEY